MSRLEPIERHEASADVLPFYERDEAAWGTVLNNTKIYAHNVQVLKALKDFVAAWNETSALPRDLKALVRARVAIHNGCPF
jgi:hypothetical protein